MGHGVDESTGLPAIAYVGETPWHGLGEKLPEGKPIEDWVKAARLDWELKRLPVQYLVDGKLRTMDDRFVLVRSDTGAGLSVVSADYEILQPKDVLEFYRDLVRERGYKLETAGALDGGRKVWTLARTGAAGMAGKHGKDDLAAYVLLATSCDKTLATTVAFTSIRVVCQNTLFFATEDVKSNKRPHVKVPHNLLFEPDVIKKQLGLFDEAWTQFLTNVGKMADFPMKADQASLFFRKLLLQKDKETLSPKAKREHEAIDALFTSAPGQELDSAKETLWGAVNAVTYYVDRVRGTDASRLDSSWFGSGCALKDRAWTQAAQLIQ